MRRIWPDIRSFKKTGIDRTGELLLEKKPQKLLYKILVLCIIDATMSDFSIKFSVLIDIKDKIDIHSSLFSNLLTSYNTS